MRRLRSFLTFRVLGTAFSLAFALVCLAIIYQDEIDEARMALNKRWEKYQTERVEAFIRQSKAELAEADEVIVLRLDDRKPSVDLGSLKISHSHDDRLFIVNKVTLSGSEAEELRQKWQDLTIHPQSYADCFRPHHALQFRSRGQTLSEVVICFICSKATIQSGFGTELVGFDEAGQSGAAYLAFRQAVESRVGAHEAPNLKP